MPLPRRLSSPTEIRHADLAIIENLKDGGQVSGAAVFERNALGAIVAVGRHLPVHLIRNQSSARGFKV